MSTGLLDKTKTTVRPPRPAPGAGPAARSGTSRSSAATAQRPAGGLLWKRRVSEGELVPLCQHLAALVGSGISLTECLRTFAEETPPGTFRQVLHDIMSDIETGRKLSAALDRYPEHFSAYFRASVWAGEESGKMPETLDRLARYLESKQDTRQRIRNAFAYPIVLVVVIVAVVSFLLLYVVPVFAGVYKRMGVGLPLPTQMLMDMSNLLVSSPWVVLAPIGLLVAFVLWTRRTPAGRLWADRWKVRVPVVGPLFKKMVLYRFTRSFGEIMGAGVLVLKALELAGRVTGNTAFMQALEAVRADVQRGTGLTEPLRRTGWFAPSILQVISSGEKSGRVPELLACAAGILERDVDLTLKRVVGRVEPILTVAMALIVGMVLLAVYLPMFDVMQHVGK
ncbi:MAG TPA: type II secretion system F family protein [Phycisphaerae bacterium]|nr:type II secretion system F family protein [Phycisphaerae bacterium]